jgi:hypothetical protein
MKKIFFLTGIIALSITLSACEKSKVKGKVIDPFTGKPVTNSTVWMKGTTFKAQSPDGSFIFEDVAPGEYTLAAGKNKFSEAEFSFKVSESDKEVEQTIFIYPRSGLKPGLFRPGAEQAEKVPNEWFNYESICDQDIFAYKETFVDEKTKKSFNLPDPAKIPAKLDLLYYQTTSSSQAIEATIYPLAKKPTAGKGCKSIDEKKVKTALFPVTGKGIPLTVTYKSNNMYELNGEMPKTPHAIVLTQQGKFLKSYYLQGE